MVEAHQLTFSCQSLHRFLFKYRLISIQILEDLRIQHHKAAVDQAGKGRAADEFPSQWVLAVHGYPAGDEKAGRTVAERESPVEDLEVRKEIP